MKSVNLVSKSLASTNRSLAAVFTGNARTIELRDIEVPELRPGQWLVRVIGCTICGSDVHSFTGRRRVPTPTILGHEIVGEIVAGHAENSWQDLSGTSLQVGDRVVWALIANCGQCFFCKHALPQKCEQAIKYGHQAFAPDQELRGGFSEYCLLVANTAMVRVPDSLPLEVACPVGCATATVVAAVESMGDLEGLNICVIGAGMLGLTACAVARERGADSVVCLDKNPDRREIALRFGVDAAGDSDQAVSFRDEFTGGRGFDGVLEFSGTNAGFECGWSIVRTGGEFVLAGAVAPTKLLPIAVEQIVRRNLTLRGVHNYAPPHLVTAVEFLDQKHNQYPFAELVSQWFKLSDIAMALARAERGEHIRIGVHGA